MSQPLLVTTPHSASNDPVLIIDKQGTIGFSLSHALKISYLPLVVSQRLPEKEIGLIHIPYRRSFPKLPNNTFSSIIVVYHGEKEILKLLPKLLKKAAKTHARFIFITSYQEMTPLLLGKLSGLPFVTIFLYGDLFGAAGITTPVSSLLDEAKRSKRVTLSGMGLTTRYPLFVNDLTTSIIETLFSQVNQYALYFISSGARTELSLVRLMQAVEPLITMDFLPLRKKQKEPHLPEEAIHLHPGVDLAKRIAEVLSEKQPVASSQHTSPSVKKRRGHSFLSRVFVAGLLLLFLPLIIELFGLVIGYSSLGLSAFFLKRSDISMSHTVASISESTFRLAEPSENLLTTAVSLFRENVRVDTLPFSVTEGRTAAELLNSFTASLLDINAALSGGNSSSEGDLRVSLKKAAVLLQSLEAQNALPVSLSNELKVDSRTISLLTNVIDIFPQLLGYSSDKTYAVVLQDNTEIRPGGGLIPSFATLTLSQGKAKNVEYYNVADTDSALNGSIEPPFPLKRYQKTAHLLLRDGSFSPDPFLNATQSAELITMETGKKLDGVIMLDLSFLRLLLGLTGPVTLPGNTTLTKETLFQVFEAKMLDTSPTQPKAFLSLLTTSLQRTISQKRISPLLFARLLTTALYQKHLIITSLDPTLEPLLLQTHVSTELSPLPHHQDSLGIYETNLGANKANYFLSRSLSQNVSFQGITASESVTLTYLNQSKGDRLGGDYTAYLQLLLPPSATISAVTINNTPQILLPAVTDPAVYLSSAFQEPSGLEITHQTFSGRELYGFPLKVKDGEERTITISYSVPQILDDSSSSERYSLEILKEAGIDGIPYHLEIDPPHSGQSGQIPDGAEIRGGKVLLEKEISEDETFSFVFSK